MKIFVLCVSLCLIAVPSFCETGDWNYRLLTQKGANWKTELGTATITIEKGKITYRLKSKPSMPVFEGKIKPIQNSDPSEEGPEAMPSDEINIGGYRGYRYLIYPEIFEGARDFNKGHSERIQLADAYSFLSFERSGAPAKKQ